MRDKILVVDDVEINRGILSEILSDEYTVLEADNGKQALEIINENFDELAAMLLDLLMPEVDGFAVLDTMKQKGWTEKIPVLVISGEHSVQVENQCFEYGVTDFIHKPFNNILVKRRVNNIANLFQYQDELEQKVEKQTETLRKQYKLLKLQADKLQQSNNNIIDILGTVVESRNFESGEHVKRVKSYTRILGMQFQEDYPEYGLTRERIDIIASASALHDLGKIAIPDHILLKPGRLTEEEFEYMKSHTTRGCEILNNIKEVWDDEYGEVSYEICRHHHERYDGKGYPDGLAGEDIPISAQIVSVADVYDALIHERVYKNAFSKEQAFRMIVTGECGVFSPRILESFRNVRKKLEII